jgi:hypothetical protein
MYAGSQGAKTNFGFTMQYTKSGSNLKGQSNIIVRSGGKIYQFKSTAVNTLNVGTTTATGTPATFNTKATCQDITDPSNPISLGGNLDLTASINDVSQGGRGDQWAVQIMNGSQLLFSSNWNGIRTIVQTLGGGNVQVRNTATAAVVQRIGNTTANPVQAATTPSATEVSAAAPAVAAANGTLLELYPNPMADQATVHFHTEKGGKAQVYLYNQMGALVATLFNAEVQSGQEYFLTLNRNELAAGVYFCRLISNGKVINQRVNIVR